MAEKIINGFCSDSDPTILQEAGCAVCGRLSQISDLSPLKKYRDSLKTLTVSGVTRQERNLLQIPFMISLDLYLIIIVPEFVRPVLSLSNTIPFQ